MTVYPTGRPTCDSLLGWMSFGDQLSVGGERTAVARQLHADVLLLAEEIDKLAGLRKGPPKG